ncbi:MAG: hypothetical protein MK073_07210 [Phycisphaerales bacterium]|nr:hypothetical protein [Phycisphaerales bacterium]
MQKTTVLLTTAIVAAATVGMFSLSGHADRKRVQRIGEIGPDVVAWTIAGENSFDMNYYGSEGGIGGYAIATQSCNFGDMEANWYGGTNDIPTIASNAFRLKDGVFEQIGMQSFMKHSFCAVSEPGCGNCQSTPCSTLGIGCADTYWAGLNANGEVPRSDVNAYTGFYNYPFTDSPEGPSSLRGNLQIANSDVDPSQNPGARYFVEGMYVTQDDADYGNQMNNASWREIEFNSISDPNGIGNGPAQTNVGDPAIVAWSEIDPEVELQIIDTDTGRLYLASKVSDNGDGTYHYEYAIHNLNCERAVGSVEINTGEVAPTNVGIHFAPTNSGSNYSNQTWNISNENGVLSWSTESYSSNANANALRWGQMYNFRFDSASPPADGDLSINYFVPGGPEGIIVSATLPEGALIDPCELPLGNCPADVNNDYVVSVGDILTVISDFGICGDGTFRPEADVNGDCCVGVSDILDIISLWGQDCTPVGACCFAGGGDWSCGITTEANCLNEGGTWQGDGSSCDSVSCPQPGACCFSDGECADAMVSDCLNKGGKFQGEGSSCTSTDCPIAGEGDEASSAMIASYGDNPFDTTTATASDPQPDENQCSGTYLDWENSDDIWFIFTPKQSGNVNFSTCDPSSYDTSMVLYEGSPDNQVTCNGDGDGGNDCQAYYSEFDYSVDAGTAYYIRIGGWQGETGAGTLTID